MKKILLIITGSIAAVKCPELISRLKDAKFDVTCVLTKAAEEFVTPLSLASLSGNKVYTDLFSHEDEAEMSHIALSRSADLLLVAPASAHMIAKMANGLCDDLASTLLLATDTPVMVAPAMNVKMWEHKATQRNVKQVQADGAALIAPEEGTLACGEEGAGRLASVDVIVEQVKAHFAAPRTSTLLKGKKALVTSGPTVEALDPVRYIANRSSGKQGYAIAETLAQHGAQVTLISGPTKLEAPDNVKLVQVESAREMLEACYKTLPVDVAVCAAAVADWRAAEVSMKKIKKQDKGTDQVFTFMENPDILECIAKHDTKRPPLVIGFAAETERVVENAKEKMARKGCDWMLANDVAGGKIFGEDSTHVHFVHDETVQDWGKASKHDTAEKLIDAIEGFFSEGPVEEMKKALPVSA